MTSLEDLAITFIDYTPDEIRANNLTIDYKSHLWFFNNILPLDSDGPGLPEIQRFVHFLEEIIAGRPTFMAWWKDLIKDCDDVINSTSSKMDWTIISKANRSSAAYWGNITGVKWARYVATIMVDKLVYEEKNRARGFVLDRSKDNQADLPATHANEQKV